MCSQCCYKLINSLIRSWSSSRIFLKLPCCPLRGTQDILASEEQSNDKGGKLDNSVCFERRNRGFGEAINDDKALKMQTTKFWDLEKTAMSLRVRKKSAKPLRDSMTPAIIAKALRKKR